MISKKFWNHKIDSCSFWLYNSIMKFLGFGRLKKERKPTTKKWLWILMTLFKSSPTTERIVDLPTRSFVCLGSFLNTAMCVCVYFNVIPPSKVMKEESVREKERWGHFQFKPHLLMSWSTLNSCSGWQMSFKFPFFAFSWFLC